MYLFLCEHCMGPLASNQTSFNPSKHMHTHREAHTSTHTGTHTLIHRQTPFKVFHQEIALKSQGDGGTKWFVFRQASVIKPESDPFSLASTASSPGFSSQSPPSLVFSIIPIGLTCNKWFPLYNVKFEHQCTNAFSTRTVCRARLPRFKSCLCHVLAMGNSLNRPVPPFPTLHNKDHGISWQCRKEDDVN